MFSRLLFLLALLCLGSAAYAVEINQDVGCDDASKWMAETGWSLPSGSKCSGASVSNLKMLMQSSAKIKKDHWYEITFTVSSYSGSGFVRAFAGVSMPAAVPAATILYSTFTPIADRFDVDTVLTNEGTGANSDNAGSTEGSARIFCEHANFGRFDPFMTFGIPGAGHPHEFVGNTDVTAYSTYQTLRTKGGSSCQRRSIAHNKPIWPTLYMWPAMLNGKGELIRSEQTLIYYKGPPRGALNGTCAASSPTNDCRMLPDGIRFIFGYNKANGQGRPDMPIYTALDANHGDNGTGAVSSGTQGAIDYTCMKGIELAAKDNPSDPTAVAATQLSGNYSTLEALTTARNANPALCPIGSKLHVTLGGPWCWDGVNLDVPDHRAHMRFGIPTMCPASHPVRLPQMSVQFYYTVDADLFSTNGWHWAVEEMDESLPRGAGAHMDYWLTGSPTVRQRMATYCIESGNSCTNQTGAGQRIPEPTNYDGTDPFCNACAKKRPDRFVSTRFYGMSKNFSGNGTYTVRVKAPGNGVWGFMGRKGFTGSLDNISIQEVRGP